MESRQIELPSSKSIEFERTHGKGVDLAIRSARLRDVLGTLGTEVLISRIVATTRDDGRETIMHATHDFVIPPQDVEILVDGGKEIVTAPTSEATLHKENRIYTYDKDLVQGLLRVKFDDTCRIAHMSIDDILPRSKVSDEIMSAIEEAFADV